MTDTIAASPQAGAALPKSLVRTLRRVIRRRRSVILARGALATVAIGLLALLALMAVHATVTIFSGHVRWLLTGGAALATILALGWYVFRPLARHVSLTRIARMVETHHPEIEERLSSAVELLTSTDDPDLLGSKALIAELTKEATAEVHVVQPRREFSFRLARPYLIAVCAAVIVLAGLAAAWPQQTGWLLWNAVDPGANTGSFGARHLQVIPGDAILAPGKTLRVKATIDNSVDSRAELIRHELSGDKMHLPMQRVKAPNDSSSSFGITLPSGDSSFRYEVLVGDKLSPTYRVTVTPRPGVASYDVRYEYPEYTGRDPKFEDKTYGDIAAVIGTTVELTATFNKRVDVAEMRIEGKLIENDGVRNEAGTFFAVWRFKLEPEQLSLKPGVAGSWTLKLSDRHKFESDPIRHTIRAVPDSAPEVIVTEPTASEVRLRPSDRLRIRYKVDEDHGIAAAALLVSIDDGDPQEISVRTPAASDAQGGFWVGQGWLDLSSLDLTGARQVQFQVRATDSLPESFKGPQHGLSRQYTITLDIQASSYIDQWVAQKTNQLEKSLNEALKELTSAKGRSSWLRGQIPNEPLTLSDGAKGAVNACRTHTANADEILYRVADEEAVPEFPGVALASRYVADRFVGPARKAAEMIRLAETKDEQNEQVKTADEYIDKAIAGVKQIIEDLKKEAKRVADALALAGEADDLAGLEEDIRETAEGFEVKPEDLLKEEVEAHILETQREIAAATADLARRLDKSAWKGGTEHQQAATSTRQTASQISRGNMSQAAQTGKKAAGQLGKLSKKLGASSPKPNAPKPPSGASRPKQARQAGELADRQKNLVKAMKALNEGKLGEAVTAMQDDAARRAQKLADEAKQYSKGLPPSDPSKKSADRAGNQLSKAAQKASQAAQQFAKMPLIPKGRYIPPKVVSGPQSPSDNPSGDPEGGQGTMGGGSNTGAGSSNKPSPSNLNQNNTMGPGKNLGKATLTAAALMNPGKPQSGPSGGSGTKLTKEAEELLRSGEAQLQNQDNPEAKGMGGMGGGQEEMAAGDSGLGGKEGGQPGKPGGRGKGGGARLRAGGGRVARRLRELGISSSDWLRLPSSLRSELLNAADERAPEEYRALVKRYFQTLARRGGNGRKSD